MIQKLKCCLLFWRQISPNYLGKSQIEERTKKNKSNQSHYNSFRGQSVGYQIQAWLYSWFS